MGTRSLTAVTFGDKIQIARVGLFDGSPNELGSDILKVLKEENGLTLCDWLYRCTEIDDTEYNKFFNNGILNKTALTEAYPDFFFGDAADLFRTLLNSDRDPVIHNDYNFAYDSLQCEWAYIIDFKEWTFEVYKGFNKTPLTPKDRFYNNGYHKGEFYPVKMIKKFDMNNLPSVTEFNATIEKATQRVEKTNLPKYQNVANQMINPKVRYGDIYSKSIIGHEVVVCCQATDTESNRPFYRVSKNGYDFTVRSIEYLPKEKDAKSRIETINEYFDLIYVLAKPLPAHPYFTVRIPYLFCSQTEESWKTITKIINEKLVYRSIPVEIWMPS